MPRSNKPTRLRPSQGGKMWSTPMPGLTDPWAPPRTVVPEYDPADIPKAQKKDPPPQQNGHLFCKWQRDPAQGHSMLPHTFFGHRVPTHIKPRVAYAWLVEIQANPGTGYWAKYGTLLWAAARDKKIALRVLKLVIYRLERSHLGGIGEPAFLENLKRAYKANKG